MTIYHIALEPIDGRYTKQWLETIRPVFTEYIHKFYDKSYSKKYRMVDIEGERETTSVTPGGFLDFAGTNIWKSSQATTISRLFNKKFIKPNDTFLFTDAWNPTIIMVKYMSELLKIPVRIVSYWHAGSYDEWDTLGYTISNRRWSLAAEKSFYEASDINVFATKYHANFFIKKCLGITDHNFLKVINSRINMGDSQYKIVVSGQPHYAITTWFKDHQPEFELRQNVIIFPHRLCREKRPDVLYELIKMLPEYKFLNTQGLNLSKTEYYRLLQSAKMVFSASEHEMLGISQMEGVLAGAFPLMPNRLSYTEMYDPKYLYPSEWTNPKKLNLTDLSLRIKNVMDNFSAYSKDLHGLAKQLTERYLSSTILWEALIGA